MNFYEWDEKMRDLFHKWEELQIELELVQLEIKELIKEHNKKNG